jgi:SAM-dependent methyltransferase
VIGRRELPEEYLAWNRKWGAPAGYIKGGMGPRRRLEDPNPARFGPFGFQFTSETREFEYPWVYFAAATEPGMRVLDVGAGLSGLQFVLASEGCEVVNVDPSAKPAPHDGDDDGEDVDGWQQRAGFWLNPGNHQVVNDIFGTNVQLVPAQVQECGLEAGSFHRVLCVSVLEHVDPAEARSMLRSMAELLAPGGLCVLTVDLFLDVKPFGILSRNRWGTNLDLHMLLERQGLEHVAGDPRELFGFREFDFDAFVSHADEYLMGSYPCVSQALVLRKPWSNGA